MFFKNLSIFLFCFVAFAKSEIQITPFLTQGTEAQIAELPFLISIQQGSVHLCTGSLISEKFSLSSGRCMSYRTISLLTIEYGSAIINPGNNTRPNVVGISKINFHPDFNYTSLENDITIVEAASEIRLTGFYEAYAHLASSGARFASGTSATHAGWGNTAPEVRTKNLHRANLRILSQSQCIDAAGETKMPLFNSICAMEESVVCAGDLGAPLLVNRIVVGVASFRNGDECVHTPGLYPNAYIAVSFYIRWIEDVTGISYSVNTFLSRN